jgi:hypothetical protein
MEKLEITGQNLGQVFNGTADFKNCKQWKRINCKQNARWQHLSQLKASVFSSLEKNN